MYYFQSDLLAPASPVTGQSRIQLHNCVFDFYDFLFVFRIMLAVVVIVLIGAVLIYFLFSIFKVVSGSRAEKVKAEEPMYDIPYKSSLENEPSEQVMPHSEGEYHKLRQPVEPELKMPEVPGQTEEELMAPEPLQQKVSNKVETPSASDVYEKGDNQAMFGSNLRHPESMIQPVNGDFNLENEIASGVASNTVNNSQTNEFSFSADMAQNGGEFMKGILAYDGTDTGAMFSSL